MPSIIDSLVLELGIDSSKFVKGQRETSAAFKKQKEDLIKSGKEIEERTKNISEFFSQLTSKALQAFALITGGKGLEQFAKEIAKTAIETGKLSRATGESEEMINKWATAVYLAGGTMEEGRQTIGNLADVLARFRQGDMTAQEQISKITALATAARAYGGKEIDVLKESIDETIKKMIFNTEVLIGKNVAGAHALAADAGIVGGMYDLAARGADKFITRAAEISKLTKEAADSVQRMKDLYRDIETKVLGKSLVGAIAVGKYLNKDIGEVLMDVFGKEGFFGTGTYGNSSEMWRTRRSFRAPTTASTIQNLGNITGMSPELIQRLQAALTAMPSDLGGFKVGSGFRTSAEQARLYAEKPWLAAPPGHSKHELGEAADLKWGSAGAENWLHVHASEFGLKFPMMGQGASGKYEPWHIEVGSININVPSGDPKVIASGITSAFQNRMRWLHLTTSANSGNNF